MAAEPCRKLLAENAPLGFTTAIAGFFGAQILAAGDGLRDDEDGTVVITQVYAGAQIMGAVANDEILLPTFFTGAA